MSVRERDRERNRQRREEKRTVKEKRERLRKGGKQERVHIGEAVYG